MAIPVSGPGNRGNSVSLNSSSSTVRNSPRTDFGAQVRNGIAGSAGAAGAAIGVAAPFVPGAAVVSAAVTGAAGGAGGLGGSQSSFGGAGGSGASSGADGIPFGGPGTGTNTGVQSTGNTQQDLMNQTRAMQEMAQSFNLQYLQLQEKMQSENRSFSTVSNVMKTKHDTAKSSISNVR